MAPAWYVIGAATIGRIAFVLMPESAPMRRKEFLRPIAIVETPA